MRTIKIITFVAAVMLLPLAVENPNIHAMMGSGQGGHMMDMGGSNSNSDKKRKGSDRSNQWSYPHSESEYMHNQGAIGGDNSDSSLYDADDAREAANRYLRSKSLEHSHQVSDIIDRETYYEVLVTTSDSVPSRRLIVDKATGRVHSLP